MKIRYACTICNNFEHRELIYVTNIPQDFVIRTECSKGHHQNIVLMNPLFTILYDNSIIAYQKKNFRNCIFEAACALERFFEHAIRVLIIPRQDIGDKEKIIQYEKTWKLVKNQTERQAGAFVMLFHKATGKAPLILTEKLTGLRNNTIHKGYLPTEQDAYEFMLHVYNIIHINRLTIRKFNEDTFWLLDQRVDFENIEKSSFKPEETTSVSEANFFNSSFGFDFIDSVNRYYNDFLAI
jgi:hypothetical protein